MKPDVKNVTAHYNKMQVETASKNKQIVLLHMRCVDLIRWARDRSAIERREYLRKAQNILAQLEAALRDGDPVAQGLYYIYDYSYILLQRGNNDDCQKAEEVLSVLCDTFKEKLNMA